MLIHTPFLGFSGFHPHVGSIVNKTRKSRSTDHTGSEHVLTLPVSIVIHKKWLIKRCDEE